VALLIGYPWHMLSLISIFYLASLPFGWKSYRQQERALAARMAASPSAPAEEPPQSDDRPVPLP
jgi:CDP-diacylglycerol--serine O-phosphatidyltransferase